MTDYNKKYSYMTDYNKKYSYMTDYDKKYVTIATIYNANQNDFSDKNSLVRTRCDQVYRDLGVLNPDCSKGNENLKDMFVTWNESTSGYGCGAAGGSISDYRCASGCLSLEGDCMPAIDD